MESTIQELDKAGLSSDFVRQTGQNNWFQFAGVDRTYFVPFGFPHWLDLSIISLNQSLPGVTHESVHDTMIRDIDDPAEQVAVNFAREALVGTRLSNGSTVTATDSVEFAFAPIASYVAGQLTARMAAVKFAKDAVDAHTLGDIDAEHPAGVLGREKDTIERQLTGELSRGSVVAAVLEAPLPAAARERAAAAFLKGESYDRIEDIPEIAARIDRALDWREAHP